MEYPLAVGNVQVVVGESKDIVVRGGPEQFDDLPTELAPRTGHKHSHLRGSHHQRLSRYQANVAFNASSRLCSGRQPIARTFSELTL